MGRGRGRGRAPCCEKVGQKKRPWTTEEDMKLIAYVQKHGLQNWHALPKRAGLLRCGKSCRLRWINYLRPDIKRGNFTKEEEATIIRLHELMGNKWSKIASCLPGRTDNEIKNVWNTHLKKRLPTKKTDEDPAPSSSSNSNISYVNNGNVIKIDEDGQQTYKNLEKDHSLEVECSRDSVNLMTEMFMELDEPSVDDCRESSSISPLESRPQGDDGKSNQDYPPEILIDPEIWSMVNDDSCFLTPEMGQVVEDGAHNHATTSIEDSAGLDESKGWLSFLEKEVDLWGTMDANAVEQVVGPWGCHGGAVEETFPTFPGDSCVSGPPLR